MAIKNFSVLILTTFLFSILSCNKEGVCVRQTGEIVTETRPVQDFHFIDVYDNINLILTQDSVMHQIRVEAGENLINGIKTEIDSGRLVLSNENTCNWLRSFEVPVNVYLTFTRLDTILFQAAGNITCTNTWANDSIYINIIEGTGDVNLKIHVSKSTMQIRYGTVNFQVEGKSSVTYISSRGYGPFHAENLQSKFTYVYTFSPNDVFVYAEEELGAEIANIGNVYYTGSPAQIDVNAYGGGKLIEF